MTYINQVNAQQISISWLLFPFCVMETGTITWFLTKLWPNFLALCDFQLWKNDFFKLWTFLCPYAYKCCVLFLYSYLAQDHKCDLLIRHRVKLPRSEYRVHLANQPFGKHVLGGFSADLWSLPPNCPLKDFVSTSKSQPSGPSASP